MAIDKNKILQNAQKLIQKQQWDKALKEYKTLAEAFPGDQAVRLKIGELYSRMGQKDAAIEELVRVAESYAKTGFYSRAVAVYKQALKIDESRADLFVSLGDLYQKLQLSREATSQFRIAINHYEKEGDSQSALKILKKMAVIEPAGLGTRAKIAELNFKEGQEAEAREEFKKIANEIRAEGRQDDLVHFLERVVSIIPNSHAEVQELAKIYVERQEPEKALAKVKILIEGGRRDEEVLSCLAAAYRLQGKMDRVKSVYKEMLRIFKDEEKQQNLKETAEAILKLDPKDAEALEILGKKAAAPPLAPRPAPAPKAAPPRIAPVTPAAPGPARPAPAAATGAGAASRFLTEADIYLKYGLKEKAADALREVLKRDPGNEIIQKKLAEIAGPAAQAERPRETPAAPPRAPEKVEPEIRPAVEFQLPSEEAVPPAPAKSGISEGIEIEFPEEGFIKGPEVELPAEAPSIKLTPEPAPAIEEEVDFDSEEKPTAPSPGPEISLSLPDFSAPTLEIGDKIGEIEAPPEEEGKKGGAAEVEEDLDEAEFYLQQGLQDEAVKIYNRVLKINPNEKRALDHLREISGGGAVSPEEGPEELVIPPEEGLERPETAASSPEKLLRRQDDSFFSPETAAPESAEEGFDLAHELEEELETEVREEAAPEDGPSFDDIFSEFKKGVEKEISLDDTQTHYDLGIAYKEMGLLDDAIQELMVAKSDPDKEADCYNLIGIIYSQKEMMEKAIEFYIKGLKSPSISKTGAIELSYELGVAYQTVGKVQEAMRVFERIARNDSEFREVKQRIAELKGKSPSAEPGGEVSGEVEAPEEVPEGEPAAPEEAAEAPAEAPAQMSSPAPASPAGAAAAKGQAEAGPGEKAPAKVRQKKISFV
ncbi:MAG: tetratricopeptide repeat protein [Proteobacteria bacterium]|nr:tetratricopeptide repeat protein [Pseudomonadota bacterium]